MPIHGSGDSFVPAMQEQVPSMHQWPSYPVQQGYCMVPLSHGGVPFGTPQPYGEMAHWGQQWHAPTQQPELAVQLQQSGKSIEEFEAIGASCQPSPTASEAAPKIRKGIRNKAMKKTEQGIEIIDASLTPQQATDVPLHCAPMCPSHQEQQSQNAVPVPKPRRILCNKAISKMPESKPESYSKELRRTLIAMNLEPSSRHLIRPLQSQPPNPTTEAVAERDTTQVVCDPALEVVTEVVAIPDPIEESPRQGMDKMEKDADEVDEDRESSEASDGNDVWVDTKKSTSVATSESKPDDQGLLTPTFSRYLGPRCPKAKDPLGPLSISDMLKWRFVQESVVLEEKLPKHLVVSSETCAKSTTSTPNSWRDEAAWQQKKSSNKENTQSKNMDQKKLKEGAESWSAQQRKRAKNLNSEGKSDEEIVRAMKSILNKLTMEKYDTLYTQMVNCGMSTVEHVQILIHEVLEKAQTQHHFVQMYCKLCVDLDQWFVENEIADTPEHSFKRILLNECQNKFEDNLNPMKKELDTLKEEDKAEAESKHNRDKLAMLGNIKFIGALLEKEMLAGSVLPSIAQELCNASLPHTLESLASFLSAVGGHFDKPKWRHHARLEAVFTQVERTRKDKNVEPRIRFLLQDLLDLRKAGWKKPGQAQGPMTIDEVHQIAAREEKKEDGRRVRR